MMIGQNRPKGRIVAVALAALAALAAFSIAGAAAADASSAVWTVAGKPLTAGSEPVPIEISKIREGLTFEVPELYDWTCSAVSSKGLSGKGTAQISGEGKGSFSELTWTGCELESNPEACEVHSVGAPPGTIAFNPLVSSLGINGSGKPYEKLSPTAAGEFLLTTIEMKAKFGHSCPFAGKYKWAGNWTLEPNAASAVEFPLKSSASVQRENGAEMLFGTKKMYVYTQLLLKANGKSAGSPVGVQVNP